MILFMLVTTHISWQRLFKIEGHIILRCLAIDHGTAGEVLMSTLLGFHCRFRRNLGIQLTVTGAARQHEAGGDNNTALPL